MFYKESISFLIKKMKLLSPIKITAFLILIAIIFSFTNDKVQKKIIRNKNFDIYFYVSLKKKKITDNKKYYWYKSGEIHESFGDVGGELLHSEYIKYYVSNQLAEKGVFDFGLKDDLWKSWHPSGVLKEEVPWNKGVKKGVYNFYSEEGVLIITGNYKNDIKDGVWINGIKKDTTWFKDGNEYHENPKIIKKRNDSINKAAAKLKKADTTKTKKTFFKRIFGQQKDSTQVKEPFFNRIFGKKKDSTSIK